MLLAWVISANINAQCNDPAPPSLTCSVAGQPENVLCTLDGYCSTSNSNPNTQNVPPSFCGSVENNVWLAFVAGSTDLQIGIDVENCSNGDGLQAQIYSDCNSYTPVSNCWNPATEEDGILTCTNLVIGQTYYLMLDGWAGDFCDFTLTEISGSTSPPIPETPSFISGPTTVCPEATVTYSIPPSLGATMYTWTIPGDAALLGGQGTNSIVVDWTGSVGGQVCVMASNACNESGELCIDVTIGPPPSLEIEQAICQEDLPIVFEGQVINQAGSYSVTYVNEFGCDSIVTLDLEVFTPFPTTVYATICEGDTYTVGNATFAQTGVYPIPLQTPEGCDSLVTLELTVLQANPIIIQPEPITCLSITTLLDGSQSTSGPAVSYLWTTLDGIICGNPTSPISAACASGTYELTVNHFQNGVLCTNTASITVIENFDPPLVEAGPSKDINCVQSCVTLEGSYSNAGTNVVVEWFGPNSFYSNALSPVVCDPGNYTLSILNLDNGCSDSDLVVVQADTTLPSVDAGPAQTLNCVSPTVLLNGSGSEPAGNITFNWQAPNGNTIGELAEVSVNAPGIYELIVVDTTNSCTASDTVKVSLDNTLPVANAGSNATINCLAPTVTLNGNGSTDNGNTIFEWFLDNNLVGDTVSVEVNTSGSYTLIVTDTTNGCSSSDMASVSENIETPIAQANALGQLTCTNQLVTLDASGSSSTNTTYLWERSPGSLVGSGFSITVNEAGTYVLTVVNLANGCEAKDTIEVTEDQNFPISSPSVSGQLTCSTPQVDLNIGSSSTGSTYSYQWLNPSGNVISNNSSVSVFSPGDFTLIVTNSFNGCTASSDITVLQDIIEPVADPGNDFTLDCNNTSFILDGSNSSPVSNISFEWEDENGTIANSSTTEIDVPGDYTLIVTNNLNGCSDEASVTISEDLTLPTANAGTNQIINCIDTSVELNGSGSGGIPNYQLEWQTSDGIAIGTNENIMVSNPDTFTLVATNTDNGCSVSDEVIVNENIVNPTAVAGQDSILNCIVTSIKLDGGNSTAQSNIEYEWSINGAPIASTASTNINAPGTYNLLVTDTENGCTDTDEIFIDQDIDQPTSEAGPENVLTCSSTFVTLEGSGSSTGADFSYTWLNAGGVTVGTELTTNVDQTGTYTLIVTDTTNGCTAADQTLVNPDNDLPLAVANASGILTCAVGQISVSSTGSTSGPDIVYSWQDSDMNPIGTGSSVDVIQPGVYTLTVENNQNGCSATSTVAVNQNIVAPGVEVLPPNIITCETPFSFLDATGTSGGDSLIFQWFDPSGTVIADTDTLTVYSIGSFVLTVSNPDNGCVASSALNITEDTTIPVAEAGTSDTITCTQTSVILDGSNSTQGADIEYTWSNSLGENISEEISLEITDPDTYALLVTNTTNGCTATDNLIISEDTEVPSAAAGSDTILNCITTLTSIGASGTSVGNEFVYSWTNASDSTIGTTPFINIFEPGNYSLEVLNTENGCIDSDNVVVNQDTISPTAAAGTDGVLTCNNPSFILDGSSSSLGQIFNYEWTDSSGNVLSNMLTLSVNTPNIYTLNVLNTENGCQANAQAMVTSNAGLPTIQATVSDTLTCDVTAVTLDGSSSTSSTGTNLQFSWSNSGGNVVSTQASTTINDPGTYSLTATDPANGCSASQSLEVEQNVVEPTANAGTNDTLTCTFTSVQLNASASSGNNLQFEWFDSDGQTVGQTDIFDINIPGTYELLVTDGINGCTDAASVIISQDTLRPIADAGPQGLLTCESETFTLNGSSSSQGAQFAYNWLDNSGNSISDQISTNTIAAGNYTLEITNTLNGCSASSSTIVNIDTITPIANAGPDGELTCDLVNITLDGSASSANGTAQFVWLDTLGNTLGLQTNININKPGEYTIVVTDLDNGCLSSDVVEITQDVALPTVTILPPDTLTCTTVNIDLSSQGSSTGNEFAYDWSDPNSQSIGDQPTLNVEAPGTYQLTIENTFNGCSTNSTVEVIQDTLVPNAIANVNEILTCQLTSLDIDGSQSSGNAPLLYEWFFNGNATGSDSILTVIEPGDYQLMVTNSFNGCEDATSVTVNQDTVHPFITAQFSDTLSCTTLSSILDGNGSSSGTIFEYQWTNQSGGLISQEIDVEVNEPGDYSFSILNTDNGCQSNLNLFVPLNDVLPTAQANVSDVLTCTTLSIPVDNGGSSTGAFTYDWIDTDSITILGNDNVLIVDQPGVYTLMVTDVINGCTSTDTVEVQQNVENPEAIIDPNNTFLITCDDPIINLDGLPSQPGGQLTFDWVFEGSSISSTNTASAENPGSYLLTVTDIVNGCIDTATVIVNEDTNPPFVSIAQPDLITCSVNNVSLDGSNSSTGPNFGLEWSGPQVDGDINAAVTVAGAPGVYQLIVTNLSTGCTNSSTAIVGTDTIAPLAVASANETIDCIILEVSLDGQGSSEGDDFTYQWTSQDGQIISGNSSLNPMVNSAGTYELVVTNQDNGCTANDFAQVIANNSPPTNIIASFKLPSCYGDNDGQITIEGATGGTPPFLYAFNEEDVFKSDTIFNSLSAGTYPVTIQDINGCEWSGELFLDQPEEIAAELGSELTIILGEAARLQVETNRLDEALQSVSWEYYADGKLCFGSIDEDCRTFIDTPFINTTYQVVVVDTNGCSASDEIFVRVKKDRDVFIPSAFSPNGDSNNDRFGIFTGENAIQIKRFSVFDRWGDIVFDRDNFAPNDPSNSWDGTFRGQNVNPGVYIYMAEIEFIDGKVILYKGDVTVVK